jgi:hypothetical protein
VAEKGTDPSLEADIIASKICPTSSSSIPHSWQNVQSNTILHFPIVLFDFDIISI